jgi:hypothetical protein
MIILYSFQKSFYILREKRKEKKANSVRVGVCSIVLAPLYLNAERAGSSKLLTHTLFTYYL